MSAYLLANVEVENEEAYREYMRRNTEIVRQHGGKFVVRGGTVTMLEGTWTAYRVVLIEFPDGAALRAWYSSPEYQEIVRIRQANARTHVLAIIEGA